MWAMRLVEPARFEQVEVETPTASALAPGEVLIRTTAGGVCGSDLPFFRGGLQRPADIDGRRPGFPLHEVAGDVVASRSELFSAGDRVVGWASGFDAIAEFVITSADGLGCYAQELSPTEAIVLQPLACALYAVEQLGSVSGSSVVVMGLGAMGLLFSHVLKSQGARTVLGVDRIDRSAAVEPFGADRVVTSTVEEWAKRLQPDDAPDVIVEAIGHQVGTLVHAVAAVRPQGRIYYFGIPDDEVYPFPMKPFLRKNLTLFSGVTLERQRMLQLAGRYLTEHPHVASALVTDVFDAHDVQAAFERASAPRPGQYKIVLSMS